MNTKTFFAAALTTLVTLASGSAIAGEATYEYSTAYTTTVTRDVVKAETLRARAAGEIATGERSVFIADTGPALSRAQVKAETLEAIRLGAISRHERSEFPTSAQLESIRIAGQKAIAMTTAAL
jgi:hypothetical protein